MLACWLGAGVLLGEGTASALDFSLRAMEPGPGHRQLTYEWKVAKFTWQLSPPSGYDLVGGAEMRLTAKDNPGEAVLSRDANAEERALFTKKDRAAQAAYFRTRLPAQAEDVKLVSQRDDPLPVHALKNFEVIYSYNLGGQSFSAAYMVSSVDEKNYFTTMTQSVMTNYDNLYGAFQRMMATAFVSSSDQVPPSGGAGAGEFRKKGVMGQ